MLSNTDLRLISKLEENGRATYIELAQALGINPSTVAKKIRALLEEGILTINAIPNPYSMGYSANAIIGVNLCMNRVDDVCNRLKSNLNVNQLVTTFGRFNLLIGVHYPTWDDVLNFISTELTETGDIHGIEPFFVKGIKKRYYGIFPEVKAEQEVTKLDETDLKMIKELAENGRYSGIYLADKLGISLSAASKRLAALLKENVIQIRAITNPTKMGFHSNAYIFIRAEQKKINAVCDQLYDYKEVSTLLTLTSSYDIYVSVLARTPEMLFDFVKKRIAPIPGVISMETLIRGEMIKRYYGSFHLDEENLKTLIERGGFRSLNQVQ
jgi:Lrp/AsnC family transcriptional regulator for asnA, asnC and gidA